MGTLISVPVLSAMVRVFGISPYVSANHSAFSAFNLQMSKNTTFKVKLDLQIQLVSPPIKVVSPPNQSRFAPKSKSFRPQPESFRKASQITGSSHFWPGNIYEMVLTILPYILWVTLLFSWSNISSLLSSVSLLLLDTAELSHGIVKLWCLIVKLKRKLRVRSFGKGVITFYSRAKLHRSKCKTTVGASFGSS